jgi:hypothetical protein
MMGFYDRPDYTELLKKHPNPIKATYFSLFSSLQIFLNSRGLNVEVNINSTQLDATVLDAFADLDRLREFHGIDNVNDIKSTAYLLFWVLRNKPLQINANCAKSVACINEDFAAGYFMQACLSWRQPPFEDMPSETQAAIKTYTDHLYYFFRYRVFTQQTLEAMLDSFKSSELIFNSGFKG